MLQANADRLNTLRRSRNGADYDMTDERVETAPSARYSITLAAKIIDELDACSKDYARLGDVKLAIKDYRSKNPS